MSRHVTWKSVASELVFGGWGSESQNPSKYVQEHPDQRLMLCLLIDIAESLRVLRCRNFQEIPSVLCEIRTNTKKRRKKRVIKK